MIEYLEWRCYMLVDFHMHSIFSDGVETPKDLLQHAIDCNVSMMALTDHDEIDGIQALRAAQKELDPNESIKIVNGCEFSADYKDKSIHILGYCFDENNKSSYNVSYIEYDNFELEKTTFLNQEFYRPNNIQKHLSSYYGDDFMIPKSYSYEDRPKDREIPLDQNTVGIKVS